MVGIVGGLEDPFEDLLNWVNATLQAEFESVDELCTGAAYCQFMDMLYPGTVPLKKVRMRTNLEDDYIRNFKILQTCFNMNDVGKEVPVGRLIQRSTHDNYDFLKWFKKYFDANYDGRQYNAIIARHGRRMGLGLRDPREWAAKIWVKKRRSTKQSSTRASSFRSLLGAKKHSSSAVPDAKPLKKRPSALYRGGTSFTITGPMLARTCSELSVGTITALQTAAAARRIVIMEDEAAKQQKSLCLQEKIRELQTEFEELTAPKPISAELPNYAKIRDFKAKIRELHFEFEEFMRPTPLTPLNQGILRQKGGLNDETIKDTKTKIRQLKADAEKLTMPSGQSDEKCPTFEELLKEEHQTDSAKVEQLEILHTCQEIITPPNNNSLEDDSTA